jgi:hypothetical protein
MLFRQVQKVVRERCRCRLGIWWDANTEEMEIRVDRVYEGKLISTLNRLPSLWLLEFQIRTNGC